MTCKALLPLLFILATFSALPAQAQTSKPSRPGNTSPSQPAIADGYQSIGPQYMQGCMQNKPETSQNRAQANYCRCTLNIFRQRYSAAEFNQISTLTNAAGQSGPTLVRQLLQPEYNQCAKQTGYK